jgi:hypothetical protein
MPYSTAVAPLSSQRNLLMIERMGQHPSAASSNPIRASH